MNNNYFESYNKRTHVIGRISSAIALVMLVGAPFLIGRMLGAMPDIGAVGKAFLSVGLVWTVSSVVEFLVYTPMLGAGGGYLAFITGNLINMKIPCAVNARDIVGAKTGTPENEIVSTLSIATSSLVTIIVLALGVALLVPLQPVLQSPTLQPAFENVVPAPCTACSEKNLQLSRRVLHTGPKSIRKRLLSYFSECIKRTGSYSFDIPYNRQQLAVYLSVERSALSNELSLMRRDGLIRYEKNHFDVMKQIETQHL